MLELKNISYEVERSSNDEGKEILKDINLSIEFGKLVVLTGPNGSGKSTLAKIIMGLEKPTKGKILFDGVDITDYSISQRAQLGIGFAFQQPIRFKGLKVKDLLRFAAGKDLMRDEACSYLSEVGLCALDYIERELNDSLSGGEMKRIELAMLIAREVKLSIFDEPEAGIDLWSFNNLINVFKKLRDNTNGSIIIISHQERILEIADKIVLVKDGIIAEEGSTKDVLPKLLVNDNVCEFYKGRVL